MWELHRPSPKVTVTLTAGIPLVTARTIIRDRVAVPRATMDRITDQTGMTRATMITILARFNAMAFTFTMCQAITIIIARAMATKLV